jgi:hypothetical protein
MRYACSVILFVLALAGNLAGQQWAAASNPANHPSRGTAPDYRVDSLSRLFKKSGTFKVQIRNFSMATINRGDFPDYYALAAGGRLSYSSPVVRNFQAGATGLAIYKLAASSFLPAPPFRNRYELGLFDVSDPGHSNGLGRMEECYLRYYFSTHQRSRIQLGRFRLATPLVNLQDSRMGPSVQAGVWAEHSEWERLRFKAGWIWKTSPRGTVRWYRVEDSFGIFSRGRAIDGSQASYAGHISTPGIAIASVTIHPFEKLEVQLWNYWIPDLFTTSFVKAGIEHRSAKASWQLGFQYLQQNSLYEGGLPTEQQYISPGEKTQVLSARLKRAQLGGGQEWALSYTRIGGMGRFLFPREWGAEPFFTFITRERMEGAGGVHAAMLQFQDVPDKDGRLTLLAQAGFYWMPEPGDAALNKYSLPPYYHLSFRQHYKFAGYLRGLEADLLYVYKGDLDGNLPHSPEFFHNKLDIHHISLVLDYYF